MQTFSSYNFDFCVGDFLVPDHFNNLLISLGFDPLQLVEVPREVVRKRLGTVAIMGKQFLKFKEIFY